MTCQENPYWPFECKKDNIKMCAGPEPSSGVPLAWGSAGSSSTPRGWPGGAASPSFHSADGVFRLCCSECLPCGAAGSRSVLLCVCCLGPWCGWVRCVGCLLVLSALSAAALTRSRCCTARQQRSAGCGSGRRPGPPWKKPLCGDLREEQQSWTWPSSACR